MRTKEEIDEQLKRIFDLETQKMQGDTEEWTEYHEGVKCTLEWIAGNIDRLF